MALMQWEPSESLATLQREMNRLFESFFDGSLLCGREPMTEPVVEVSDTKDAIVVKAQVPGVSQEQLQVMVSEGSLTIKGETKTEEKKEEKNYLRREFRYGAFARTLVPRIEALVLGRIRALGVAPSCSSPSVARLALLAGKRSHTVLRKLSGRHPAQLPQRSLGDWLLYQRCTATAHPKYSLQSRECS
jgi:HSP20 family protein